MSAILADDLPSTFVIPWHVLAHIEMRLEEIGFEPRSHQLRSVLWLYGMKYCMNWQVAYDNDLTKHLCPPELAEDGIEDICASSVPAMARAIRSDSVQYTLASIAEAARIEGPLKAPIWTALPWALRELPSQLTKQVKQWMSENPGEDNFTRFVFGLGVCCYFSVQHFRFLHVFKEPIRVFNSSNKEVTDKARDIMATLDWKPELLHSGLT